jgi:hypothetical protein
MRNWAHLLSLLITPASVFLAAFALVGCEQSQKPVGAAETQSAAASTEKVFVIFEGPWAIVTDPKDANSVLVLAPKTKSHRDLYVAASNDSTLQPGTYDLSVPSHGAATSAALDPGFAQAKIDAKSLQRALDNKSGRYVIRLPKPEAYVAARRTRGRIGPSYPPDAATEQNYANVVSFRYNPSSLNGFSLAGSPDTGTFNPLLLQLETPTIRFAIEPAQADDPKDMCDTHSREGFRDSAKFLGLTLYVDFPTYSENCHKTDPQTSRSTKAGNGGVHRFDQLGESDFRRWEVDLHPVGAIRKQIRLDRSEILATIDWADPVSRYLSSVLYFFHYTGADCKVAILFLTVTP